MKWTEQDISKLRKLAFAEKSNAQIAEAMGITVSEVYTKRSQIGITIAKIQAAKGGAAVRQEESSNADALSTPFDVISLAVSCKQPGKSEEQSKIDFCELLLEQFAKLKGEQLAPHLSEFTFSRKDRCSYLCFRF